MWQWDTGVHVATSAEGAETASFARAGDSAATVVRPVAEGRFPIPDRLLQRAGRLAVWIERDGRTVDSAAIEVIARPKPDDYVATDIEVETVARVREEMDELRRWVERKVEDGTGPRGSGISAGSGAPSLEGRSGDLYIDTENGALYEYGPIEEQGD